MDQIAIQLFKKHVHSHTNKFLHTKQTPGYQVTGALYWLHREQCYRDFKAQGRKVGGGGRGGIELRADLSLHTRSLMNHISN